ncbi:hypothetical protein AAIR98_001283 [Elusimicrobium simillimum]|uniref:hypothetical protein n=1 Tax=Elusimicrobium simillimum TaxID=3143438 RepID=UPI003C701492
MKNTLFIIYPLALLLAVGLLVFAINKEVNRRTHEKARVERELANVKKAKAEQKAKEHNTAIPAQGFESNFTFEDIIEDPQAMQTAIMGEGGMVKQAITQLTTPVSGKNIYLTSYPVIKEIINSQQRYYLQHGKYTTDANEIDLEFPQKNTVQRIGPNTRLHLDNSYMYMFNNNSVAAFYKTTTNKPEMFFIDFDYNGKDALCIARTTEGEQSCKELGGVLNTEIESASKIYNLPENFLETQLAKI